MTSSADQESASQSVLTRTVLSSAGMAVQGLARFVYTLAIGRLAGPEALSDVSALLSTAVYLSLVLPAGLGVAASRYLPDAHLAAAANRQLQRWFWASSIGLSIVAAPIAFWVVGDLSAAIGCAVLVFAYNLYVFTRGALMGEDRILRSTIADFVGSLVAVTSLIAVLLFDVHWALLLPLAVGYVIFGIAAWPITPVAEQVSADQRALFARFVRDASLGALATGGLLPATMVFVRAYDTPLQAGLFAAALSLATPASLVSQAVNQVLIPHFARFGSDLTGMLRSYRKLLVATLVLFTVVFGLLIMLAQWVISWLYGDRYADGTQAMQALLVVVFLISATAAPSALLVASGRQRSFAVVWAIAFVLGTTTMVWASSALGMWGALLGFAIGGGGGSLAIIVLGSWPQRPPRFSRQ